MVYFKLFSYQLTIMTEAAVKIETSNKKCKDVEALLLDTQNQLKDAKV